MSDGLRRSPLQRVPAVEAPAAGVRLGMWEIPFRGYLNLRGASTDRAFTEAVAAGAGMDLPLTPNTVAGDSSRAILWLGPDEWLIVTAPGAQPDLCADLTRSLAGTQTAVTDLSAGYATVRLRGALVPELLAKGCSLDLHPRIFGPGRCAQTNVAKTSAIVWSIDQRPTFDLIVRRSFAEYLATWLLDAGNEHGLVLARGEPATPE